MGFLLYVGIPSNNSNIERNMASTRLFHLYRYQINPNERIQERLPLGNNEYTVEQTIAMKNDFFIEAWRNLALNSQLDEINANGRKLKIKEVYPGGNKKSANALHIFMVAACKSVTRETEDFDSETTKDWPRVYVIVWNLPDRQVLAIEHRTIAFSKTNTLANNLTGLLNNLLTAHNLNIQIHPIFDKQSFWDLVHNRKVEQVEFKMVTPNMANISHTLSEDLKALAKTSNSAVTDLVMNATEGGSLNITPQNERIQDLVDYSSKGGGTIKVKFKGVRNREDTNNKHSSMVIQEGELEGYPKDLAEFIDKGLGK